MLENGNLPQKPRRTDGTVWIFHDFSITLILREINFRDSKSEKSAIFAILEALDFEFYEFLHLLKVEIYQINHFQSP